jgi:hypothetical protein
MMISLASLVVPETADIRLELGLFFNLDGNNLDLIIGKTDFNLEHSRHDELIGLNRVKVVLLLLFTTLRTWNMYLILLPI